MAFSPQLLNALEELEPARWQGTVYRHMFGEYPPSRENTRGARWNPPDTAAIYTSLERDTALAEAQYRLALESIRPRVSRSIYTLSIRLKSVLDIRSHDILGELGLSEDDLRSVDYATCQEVGGAVSWLQHDGLIVPSVRKTGGSNIVIFPTLQDPIDTEFEVLGREVLADGV